MDDRGQEADVLSVLGVGEGEEHPSPDPNVAVLAARMEQIEAEMRLQALYRAQMETAAKELKAELARVVRQKEEAEQALRAALEARQKSLETAPQDPHTTNLIVAQLEKENAERRGTKRQAFIKDLQSAKRGTVRNDLGHSVLLTINGVSTWIIPGVNELPAPFVEAWGTYLEDLKFASERRELFSGGDHEYNEFEQIIAAGRQGDHSGRGWSGE